MIVIVSDEYNENFATKMTDKTQRLVVGNTGMCQRQATPLSQAKFPFNQSSCHAHPLRMQEILCL